MPDLPTGTVTFLFTDVEGSTQLWERFPDAMKRAVGRHDAILRSAIEANGGRVFKTVGDDVGGGRLDGTGRDLVVGGIVRDRIHVSAVSGCDGSCKTNRIHEDCYLLVGPLMAPANVRIMEDASKINEDRRRSYQLKRAGSPPG